MLRRGADPGPSAERRHEARTKQQPTVSVAENVDRAIFGGFSEGHPGDHPHRRRPSA